MPLSLAAPRGSLEGSALARLATGVAPMRIADGNMVDGQDRTVSGEKYTYPKDC